MLEKIKIGIGPFACNANQISNESRILIDVGDSLSYVEDNCISSCPCFAWSRGPIRWNSSRLRGPTGHWHGRCLFCKARARERGGRAGLTCDDAMMTRTRRAAGRTGRTTRSRSDGGHGPSRAVRGKPRPTATHILLFCLSVDCSLS
jgi:hypothetical protein